MGFIHGLMAKIMRVISKKARSRDMEGTALPMETLTKASIRRTRSKGKAST